MGRKLFVRVHLAAYILQKVYDLTDRQVEYGLNDNAAYQHFSGKGIVAGWRPSDHTKVEEFRSSLLPEGLAVDMKAVKAKPRGYFFMPKNVASIRGGKVGKDKEFGGVFQLDRIKWNFLCVSACRTLFYGQRCDFLAAVRSRCCRLA